VEQRTLTDQAQRELNDKQAYIEQELGNLKKSFKEVGNTEGGEVIINELREYIENCKELHESIGGVKEKIENSLIGYNNFQTTMVRFIEESYNGDDETQEKLDDIVTKVSGYGRDINLLNDSVSKFIAEEFKKHGFEPQGGGQLGDLQLDIHNYKHRLNGGMSQDSITQALEQLEGCKQCSLCPQINNVSEEVSQSRKGVNEINNDDVQKVMVESEEVSNEIKQTMREAKKKGKLKLQRRVEDIKRRADASVIPAKAEQKEDETIPSEFTGGDLQLQL